MQGPEKEPFRGRVLNFSLGPLNPGTLEPLPQGRLSENPSLFHPHGGGPVGLFRFPETRVFDRQRAALGDRRFFPDDRLPALVSGAAEPETEGLAPSIPPAGFRSSHPLLLLRLSLRRKSEAVSPLRPEPEVLRSNLSEQIPRQYSPVLFKRTKRIRPC
jgi:hypothetical protein